MFNWKLIFSGGKIMSKPHYVIRRSRSGRFNFTLLSAHGRMSGLVMIQTTGKTKLEIELAAHEKIRHLVADLAAASRFEMNVDSLGAGDLDTASSHVVEDEHMYAAVA